MRVRTLVNPFSVRETLEPVSFSEIFSNPELPVDLEIGTGQGNFFVDLCALNPARNHLGIELRPKLVAHANQKLMEKNLKNGRVFYGNIHHCLENLINGHTLEAIYIFFPDPWEKRRHANRRLLTPDLAQRLVSSLKPQGSIYIQTDVDYLLKEICNAFNEIPTLQKMHVEALCPENLWRSEIGEILSNRERDALKTGLNIYRTILRSM